MRRAALFLLPLLACLLSACTAAAQPLEPADLVFHFSCKAEITSGETQVSCEVDRTGPGILRVSIVKPDDLSGMDYYWSGEGRLCWVGSAERCLYASAEQFRFDFAADLGLCLPPGCADRRAGRRIQREL